MLTEKQRQARRSGIGGSDIGAILGVNPYKTPVQLWLEKTDQVEPEDISDKQPVRWGNILEGPVADEYARVTGRKLRKINKTLIHKTHKWWLAHIDRDIVGEPGGLEIKTTGAFANLEAWGEPGTDQVPMSYLLQCAWYMAVVDAAWWDLAVLRGGQEFAIYTIHRDHELEAMLEAKAAEFWNRVKTGVPPKPRDSDDILALHRTAKPTSVVADDDTYHAAMQLQDVVAEIKIQEERKKTLEFKLKSAMEDNEELLAPDGKMLATWKEQTRRTLDKRRVQDKYPEVAEECTKESTIRVFMRKKI